MSDRPAPTAADLDRVRNLIEEARSAALTAQREALAVLGLSPTLTRILAASEELNRARTELR